jgi:nucleoside-diphosphate-sugar epimerase
MILLTGATGKIGGETAKQLIAKGASLPALIRDEARAADPKAAGVELVVGDIAGPIKSQRKFFLPMGDGTTGMAGARDISAICAEVLTGESLIRSGVSSKIT